MPPHVEIYHLCECWSTSGKYKKAPHLVVNGFAIADFSTSSKGSGKVAAHFFDVGTQMTVILQE
jgi:hypothetical protein